MALIIGIIVVVIIAFFAIGMHANSIQKKFEEEAIMQIKDMGFSFSKQTKTDYGIIAIDESRRTLLLVTSEITIKKWHEIPYDAIISCELGVDGKSVFKKSTLRTIGGAVVGGAVMGGVGAIVGGLSGNYKENKNIKVVEIKVLVRSTQSPSYRFKFFGDATNKVFLKMRLEQAEMWKDTISVIIDDVDKKSK